MLNYPFNYPKIEARFVRRINRFVLLVDIDGREEEAYLANPGRLWELLLPGARLLLAPSASKGKLPYTVLACLKGDIPVLLHTHLTNKVIRRLIDENRLDSFMDYRVIKEEPACGKHRFDLLLQRIDDGSILYLEIKSCTLFAGKVAMFPDAVTSRGKEHLLKLGELAGQGIKTGCLFVIMNPGAEYFLPAYHIDPDFAHAFMHISGSVGLQAIAIGFDHTFTAVQSIKELSIPFPLARAELQDRGVYLLILAIDEDRLVTVGKMGELQLKAGYYVYAGSAMKNLSKRIARHRRKQKKSRWHIDYLTALAASVTAVPILTADRLECELAGSVRAIAAEAVAGFGSSDCRCPGHLFFFSNNPLNNPRFIDLIQYCRIARLEDQLDLL